MTVLTTKMDAIQNSLPPLAANFVQRLRHLARKLEGQCLPVLDKPEIRGYTIHIGYIQRG